MLFFLKRLIFVYYGREYRRVRAGISPDKGGDIAGQGRRYLRGQAEK